ncbi:MAG: hypothetical protein WKF87_22520 [Chryseolinea sp.]
MIGIKQFALAILFSLSTIFLSAQPSAPQDPPQGDPDNRVPITGLEILLISGGAYGIAQLRRKGNSKKSEM